MQKLNGVELALLDDFMSTAKKEGISSKQSQSLVDWYLKQMSVQAEAQEQQWFEQREAWVNELKNDPEFGNSDDNTFKANVGKAQLVLKQFGTPEFREFLMDTGLGNNVHLLKLMAKVGGALPELLSKEEKENVQD